jgi:hypothetical protein
LPIADCKLERNENSRQRRATARVQICARQLEPALRAKPDPFFIRQSAIGICLRLEQAVGFWYSRATELTLKADSFKPTGGSDGIF